MSLEMVILTTPEQNKLGSDVIRAIMCLESWLIIPEKSVKSRWFDVNSIQSVKFIFAISKKNHI